jgi:hypothetical protein
MPRRRGFLPVTDGAGSGLTTSGCKLVLTSSEKVFVSFVGDIAGLCQSIILLEGIGGNKSVSEIEVKGVLVPCVELESITVDAVDSG